MDGLFKFIKDRFLLMPQWVQVFTYVSFVILFIYLLTAPRFLDMRLVSNDYGDEFPIGGAQIEIEIEGRVLILLTDSKGRFSVPISTNYPIGSYLFILSPDSNSTKIKEIKVPVSNSYLKRSKIIYTKKTNSYKIVPNGIIENTQQLLLTLNPISIAYADDNRSEPNDDIDKEIFRALEVITKIKFDEISKNISLRDDLSLDNIDLSYINNRLNKKYNIDSLFAFQQRAKTVSDLIEIARANYYQNTLQQQNFNPETNPKQRQMIAAIPSTQLIPTEKKEIIPSDILVKYKLDRVLRKSERYIFAVKILEQVIEKQPKFYKAWFHLALTYESMGENDKAEAAFKSAIEIERAEKLNDDLLYNAYGMFLFKQEKYKEAGEQFEKEKQFKQLLPLNNE
ncbi:MAG: hypothetical protein Q9M50_09815 [Methylococcales bacterium]|nr:hypothetical protein [Methylococcales bacterium]